MVRLGSVTIGQYYPVESTIHRLDPRIKIIITLLFMIGLFLVRNFWGFLAFFLLVFFAIYLAQLPLKLVVRGLRPIIYFLFFTIIIHLFFTRGEILFHLGPLAVTQEGIRNGLFVTSRLLLLVVGTSFLTLTTTPIQLTDAIEFLLKPGRKIRVPAHEIAMMITIALRFIPTLVVEAEKIMKSQMARGADFESGNVLRRARNYIPLLIPLFIGAFRRADELALAMEARLYRGGEGRTRLRELQMELKDWLGFVVSTVFIIAVSWIGRF